MAYGISARRFFWPRSFHWRVFPVCFVEGVGLTPFKIYSEYVDLPDPLAAIGLLVREREGILIGSVLILIMASIAAAIAEELAFTTYLSVYWALQHDRAFAEDRLLSTCSTRPSSRRALVSRTNLLFRELKQSEAKFRSIFETNVVPIAYCHMDGRVLDANDDYLRLLGYTRGA